MAQRIDYTKVGAGAYKAVLGLETYVRQCGLEHSLIELVKLRASYINGCAYCVDMHSKDALAAGESAQRIFAVPVWRETPFFTPRERAALAFTETVTLISRDGVPDDVYEATRQHFSDEEMVSLTMAVATINVWNRVAITFQSEVGSYQPAARTATTGATTGASAGASSGAPATARV
jgi:AhpD family alkylhydroperoxidase